MAKALRFMLNRNLAKGWVGLYTNWTFFVKLRNLLDGDLREVGHGVDLHADHLKYRQVGRGLLSAVCCLRVGGLSEGWRDGDTVVVLAVGSGKEQVVMVRS